MKHNQSSQMRVNQSRSPGGRDRNMRQCLSKDLIDVINDQSEENSSLANDHR